MPQLKPKIPVWKGCLVQSGHYTCLSLVLGEVLELALELSSTTELCDLGQVTEPL